MPHTKLRMTVLRSRSPMIGHLINHETGWTVGDVIFRNRKQVCWDMALAVIFLVFYGGLQNNDIARDI